MMMWIGPLAFQSIGVRGMAPDYSISGFPEYMTDIATLDPVQRRDVSRAAREIVASLRTKMPVRGILVVGNADVALRKAIGERAQFELDVSQTRAASGRKVLLDEIAASSGNPSARYFFKVRVLGMGSSNRKIVNPVTEAQMKQNRRVEYYLFRESLGSASCGCEG